MKYFFSAICLILTNPIFSQNSYSDYSSNQKEVIFYDHFDNNANAWWIGNNADCSGVIEGGSYILEWKGETPIWYSYKGIQLDISKDFEVEASIKQIAGATSNLFGIIFNKSENHESAFIINVDNSAVVYSEKRGQERTFLKPGGEVNPQISVKTDFNKLTIRRVNGEFQFYVNEVFLKSGFISDFASSSFGFQIWYKSRIAVDFLKVSYLKKLPSEIISSNPVVENRTTPILASDIDTDVPVVAKQNTDA